MASFAMASRGADLDQTSASEKALQKKALDETLSTLLTAGYFRARAAALTPFDKVVGGMCWGISSSGIAVEADVFYDEELALGAKMCGGGGGGPSAQRSCSPSGVANAARVAQRASSRSPRRTR